jgi:cysteine-rich repeat protein
MLNVTKLIEIDRNKIIVRKENYSDFNKSFEVVFKNISFTHPVVKADGKACSSNVCVNTSYNASSKEFTFIVPESSEDVVVYSPVSSSPISITGNVVRQTNTASGKNKFSITGNVVYEVVEQCTDGIQDGDEEGVDCGGSCSACPSPPPGGGSGGGSGGGGGGNNNGNRINYTANCGNNLLDIAEECDDGNILSGDGCSSICVIEETEQNNFDGTENPSDLNDGFFKSRLFFKILLITCLIFSIGLVFVLFIVIFKFVRRRFENNAESAGEKEKGRGESEDKSL